MPGKKSFMERSTVFLIWILNFLLLSDIGYIQVAATKQKVACWLKFFADKGFGDFILRNFTYKNTRLPYFPKLFYH
jgi:hypothetical protein